MLNNNLINFYNKSRIARFGFFGAINTVIGFITYPAIYFFFSNNFSYIEVLYISFIISTHFAFLTTKYYVFKSPGSIHKEYIKFMIFHLLILGVNLIFLPIFVEIFLIHPSISQIIFSVILMLLSYFWHLKITFKDS
ncbi:MAG: GtrA family protein [Gammaproteobacteria bacterium]|nr:GtrA family protein [Gammaproteobacteria bacterium]